MAEFRVVLEGIDLSKDKHRVINAAIQKAVLPHLADLDLEGDQHAVAIPDMRWRGIWVGPITTDRIRELEPRFEQSFGDGF